MTKVYASVGVFLALGCDEDPLKLRAARAEECDGLGGVALQEGDETFLACNGTPGLPGDRGAPGAQGPQGDAGPPGTFPDSPFVLGELRGSVDCSIDAETNLGEPFTQRGKTWFFSSGWTFSSVSLVTSPDGESQSDFTPAGINPTFSFMGAPILSGVITFEMNLTLQRLEVSQGDNLFTTLLWDGPNCIDERL